jgi:hypothetical protein
VITSRLVQSGGETSTAAVGAAGISIAGTSSKERSLGFMK